MAVETAKNVPSPTSPPAKQRLLDAATRVFAAHGFEGATTREIAHEAGVNEVTLFRVFQTKENLQTAVLQRVFDQQAELLAAQPKPLPSSDLHAEVARIAKNYLAALQQNISLIRTLLGEIHRHRDHEKQALQGIFDPLRTELLAVLEQARQAGLLRPEIDPQITVSMLPGMILSNTLRRSVDPCKVFTFSDEAYLAACLEVFIRGISA